MQFLFFYIYVSSKIILKFLFLQVIGMILLIVKSIWLVVDRCLTWTMLWNRRMLPTKPELSLLMTLWWSNSPKILLCFLATLSGLAIFSLVRSANANHCKSRSSTKKTGLASRHSMQQTSCTFLPLHSIIFNSLNNGSKIIFSSFSCDRSHCVTYAHELHTSWWVKEK